MPHHFGDDGASGIVYTKQTIMRKFTVADLRSQKSIIMTLALGILIMMTMASCNSDEDQDAVTEGNNFAYEESPSTLEGTWHLTKAFYNYGGFQEINPGDVTVIFSSNHTMQVINKTEGNEVKHFMDSGTYPFDIVETTNSIYDGITYTLLDIDGKKCTYWLKDGMMTLDFGMAVDAPGYYFKKLKGH